ncbi:cohesin complex subunit psm1 [Cantharellus anzutake]|uniref:cohesin complex subunit psm1 n=1 Tax=Cantharellus anzutake TaxID=1750568 RepID=UPI001907AD53|nr:cohesin complex subunit psm1 [Cantharellus anzutake]KAF8342909.1 cohesin complex subunit psm1 [Cantharellus anzutake]
MPLIRIEVCNFKSYRGHQIIGPFKNFTSVIGPNGAGKSNLMDAISFVLGVKSAQLRSSQLKDLIYRGRRLARQGEGGDEVIDDPESDGEDQGEGSATKAWVLAVYEETGGTQYHFQRTQVFIELYPVSLFIHLFRRISTAGGSEYRLNNRVVTYQAYNQTLEKHNILVKAKNFLVFQGDVEAVASQSPKDLTRLIEQISGSLELSADYDRTKAAQDRATESATFSYTKRRGIAGEIKQFKEQKAEAERFERKCKERDSQIINRFLWRLFHIEENINKNTATIKGKSKEISGLKKEQAQSPSELLGFSIFTPQILSRKSTTHGWIIKTTEKLLEGKNPGLVAVDTQIAHTQRKIAKAKEMSTTVAKEVLEQEKSLTRLSDDLETVRKAATEAEEEQRRATQKGLALSEETLSEYRSLKAKAATEAVNERQQIESLTRDEKAQSRNLATLEYKRDQLKTQREKLNLDVESTKAVKNESEEKVANLQQELAQVRQELRNHESEKRRITQLEREVNEKLADCHRKLLAADVDRKETEREAKLKETFSALQKLFPGVRGRVVDLCKPTSRKYEIAVSVILGRNIDAIVVDHEKTAIDCIEYMRNQRAGIATFIPLDTIQIKPVNDKFRSIAKGARLAVDVIQFDASVERAMHHACGNALVCDTMDVARYVVYEKGQEVKAVTLDGTIIHKSGLITGGKSTHGSGKKWEENEIQGVRRAQETYLSQLRELQKAKPRGQVEENLTRELSRLESTLAIARDDHNANKTRLTGLQSELRHIEKELASSNPEHEAITSALAELRTKMASFQQVIDAADDKIFASFCRTIKVKTIREYEERQLRAMQEGGDIRMRFRRVSFDEAQLQATRDRLTALQKIVESDQDVLQKLVEKKSAVEQEIESLKSEIGDHKSTLKNLSGEFEQRTKALEENDEIESLASERFQIYRKCRLEEIALPLEEGSSLDDVPLEEDVDDAAMEVDDDGLRPRQVQDYGIEVDFGSLDESDKEDGSASHGAELDADISKIISEIEQMTPNMKAMARLDDVEAKLIDTDKETEKARKEVKTARDEFNAIRKKRTDLFNRAYSHISDGIDKVYKDLTKGKAAPLGGVAYLNLEDTEVSGTTSTSAHVQCPLLGTIPGGVKYTAMPPMKRFRDMDQLSGGEKTVAALALLYQPSPFFVLDEVDAALDNTNVAKIANYIRSQASETFQFIVISLKGSLYERGNSLVGIYRDQDLNSSKTMTLDLTVYAE